MFKTTTLILALALSLMATSASARDMTVQQFLTTAAGIPQNATAMLRSDTRRLIGEFRGAYRTVRDEQEAATRARRRPATCMPAKVPFSPAMILGRFNAIPAGRRATISVTQAMREWMIDRYPCPAA